ncbi:putative F-box protein At3g16210 [Bidens hawaiensis]|uniref:putative F-box protein At3g16210 n=1 Tax=Bidens hawaiensis TaxID=980011 RepID=UPI00404974A9
MSDHIPFEIQVEIIKRLPVSSLIRSRSVSKTWKSLIDSSQFVTSYSSQQKHIFVMYETNQDGYKSRYVSVVDDHTFPINKVSPPPCFLVDQQEHYFIIGSCHGLLCFYTDTVGGGRAVVWNPSIRRAYDVVVPNMGLADGTKIYGTVLGSGVCPVTKDPKIVKINFVDLYTEEVESISSIPFQVEVFTLSTGAWRSLSGNLPRKPIYFNKQDHNICTVAIDGFIYWLAFDRISVDDELLDLIVSFDITREEFGEINLPDRLTRSQNFLYMSNLRESLVVLEHVYGPHNMVYNLWMMEGGLFTQLYTFNVNTPCRKSVMGFRSDDPIILVDGAREELVVYKPQSSHMDKLEFDGAARFYSVHPYTESLFLLDQNSVSI